MIDRPANAEVDEKRLRYSVPALEKGLDILEHLAEQAVPVTQAQLARSLGRQPGELFRMLACLEGRGYLHRDVSSGGYLLTLRMFEMSRAHSPYDTLLRAARPLMRRLADETRESCHLSVLYRNKVLVLAQEESPKPFRLSVEVGSQHPPMRTTSGRLLLSGVAATEIEDRLLDQPAWIELGATSRAMFLDRIAAIRAKGYDQAVGERFVGGADIGVLIGTPGSAITAALTIARLVEAGTDADTELLIEPLRRCAAEIAHSAGLAHDPGREAMAG